MEGIVEEYGDSILACAVTMMFLTFFSFMFVRPAEADSSSIMGTIYNIVIKYAGSIC